MTVNDKYLFLTKVYVHKRKILFKFFFQYPNFIFFLLIVNKTR